jgi:hypothetical protein
VGRTVHTDGWDVGTVERVFRSLGRTHMLRVRGPGGPVRRPLAGTCELAPGDTVAAPYQGWVQAAAASDDALVVAAGFNEGSTIWRMAPSEGAPRFLARVSGGPVTALRSAGSGVDYAFQGGFWSVASPGAATRAIATSETTGHATSFEVDGAGVCFWKLDALERVTAAGGSTALVATTPDRPWVGRLWAWAGYIYWFTIENETVSQAGDLRRVPHDGGKIELLARGAPMPKGDAVFDQRRIYWLSETTARKCAVQSAELAGGAGTAKALATVDACEGIAQDDSSIYWGHWGGVGRVAKDGGAVEEIPVPGADVKAVAALRGWFVVADDSRKRLVWWPR